MRFFALFLMLVGSLVAEARMDGHFASWEEVPEIIESIRVDHYDEPLDKLLKLTNIQMGTPQVSMSLSKEEHGLYMMQTKANWQAWWEKTGKSVAEAKKNDSKIDAKALEAAVDFLGVEGIQKPQGVWIPETWALNLNFTNGDYGGRVHEIWMIDRGEKTASLTRLRYSMMKQGFGVKLEKVEIFTPAMADQLLRTLCYVNQYAPYSEENDEMDGLYYPSVEISLRNGDRDRDLLWNIDGFGFSKSYSEHYPASGNAGRSYWYLHSRYKDTRKWKEIAHPTSQDLAPYRELLAANKPYLFSLGSDVVTLFGERGGKLELEVLRKWAEKQKEAIKPEAEIHWTACCDHFGTGARVNIRNFTRLQFEKTVKKIIKIEKRLGLEVSKDLQKSVKEMKELEVKEEEAEIMSFPQPLRDLVRIDRVPHDPNLALLETAINEIRKKPDPKLFTQLAAELDDGTLEMRSLLRYVMFNDHGLLDLNKWGKEQEKVAVFACIDALPAARAIGELDDLVEIILTVCGGGEIEVEDGEGGTSVELKLQKNGYSVSYGGAENPLPMKEAQKRLKQMYLEGRR